MENFNKNFNRISTFSLFISTITMVFQFAVLIAIVFLGYTLITDPASVGEVVGEFVNKIVEGFEKGKNG